jgi:hypothetical protein
MLLALLDGDPTTHDIIADPLQLIRLLPNQLVDLICMLNSFESDFERNSHDCSPTYTIKAIDPESPPAGCV